MKKTYFHNKLISFNRLKLWEYRIGIKFYKDPLAVEQNHYLNKVVNLYVVYNLEAWTEIPLRNFTLTSFLFRATNIVKNSNEESMFLVATE